MSGPLSHTPVLLREVLAFLNPQPNQNFIDCTFGGGGHGLEILNRVKPDGIVIGLDWDSSAVKNSRSSNLILINDNYRHLKKIYQRLKNDYPNLSINGILLDLGLSSDQLGATERGFSFTSRGPLDLRYNQADNDLTGAQILKTYSQEKLIDIFKTYGEEPLAKPIARAIVKLRQAGENIETADMLVRLISDVYHHYFKKPSRLNPATRVFQALRIAVNDELGNLRAVLPQVLEILVPGGRLAVISFHSGEDRIVKNYCRDEAKRPEPRLKIITKKPIGSGQVEIKRNPASRSAKLRVFEKIF